MIYCKTQVLDGGTFEYVGDSSKNNYLKLNIAEEFSVRGGGMATFNKVVLNAANITLDVDSVVDANGKGNMPDFGTGKGRAPFGGSGGSGGSHGGLGGRGSHANYANKAYGSCLEPSDFGSGGALMVAGQTDGAGDYIKIQCGLKVCLFKIIFKCC